MDVSQDTPLVEGALSRQLGCSAFQDSVTSVSRDRPLVNSISPEHSGIQSDSSPRIPVIPLTGASGLSSTRRITVPSQIGKVKGKGGFLTGICLPRN